MYTQMLPRMAGALLVGLLLSWTSTEGAETHATLMEKYGLKAGMKITKENADLIKDLVPEAFYRRVVAGDYVLTIGKFDPPDILKKTFPDEYYHPQHAGKFDVGEDGGVIDKVTGQRPWPLPYGPPFPQLDLKEDPKKVGAKIMWNAFATPGVSGDFEGAACIYSAPPRGWYDRFVVIQALRQYIDFRPTPIQIDRPLVWQEVSFFHQPAEAFGTASLTWRWADPKKWDSVWSYSPATRRVRRVTAANRSDSVFGTEFIQDDSNAYLGKVEMFQWRYVQERPMLIPVMPTEDQPLDDYVARLVNKGTPSSRYPQVPNAYQNNYKRMRFPFQESPQQYVSWWPLDTLWVPVWGYVVEGSAKDPYYNYGRQIIWIEPTVWTPFWKEVYNRAGEYWRTAFVMQEFTQFWTADNKLLAAHDSIGLGIYDEKSNRGTVALDTPFPTSKGLINAHYNLNSSPEMFSLSKFLEYGK